MYRGWVGRGEGVACECKCGSNAVEGLGYNPRHRVYYMGFESGGVMGLVTTITQIL